jgi:hypothetical protein
MYNKESIEKQFAKMGARVKVKDLVPRHNPWASDPAYRLDVRTDKKGEYFDIEINPEDDPDFLIVNVEPKDRHLLLVIKQETEREGFSQKDRYLCGHDERSWFVAAVPGGATTVYDAKENLKPAEARESQSSKKVKNKNKHKRHNEGYKRQGEWFFVPRPNLDVKETEIIRNEPIRRGGGKAHMVEEVHRTGGSTVYVCRKFPNGVDEVKYKQLLKEDGGRNNWRAMRRDAEVFCRGKVSHPDHATIELPTWHKVIPNTESTTSWMTNMTFLD